MLCRTSKLIHPSGVVLETPLLVPSFSSKGFGFRQTREPEVKAVFEVAREYITKTCLVSAYDIYYGYIPQPEEFISLVDILFLDSGGYEVSNDYDLSTVEKSVRCPRPWDAKKLQKIWKDWPESLPAVFVSYDHPAQMKPVAEQLRDAKEAASAMPDHLHLFLLKPESQRERSLESALQSLQAHVEELAEFHLLGVTEKELGDSPLERMVRIAHLRHMLDNSDINIPIHVFGALDPISVSLYFVSGAEIFDGLTWSRYAYSSGLCIYLHNHATAEYGLEVNDDEARVRTIEDNLRYLDRLERSLRLLAKTGDWDRLDDNRDLVQAATKQMLRELRRNG